MENHKLKIVILIVLFTIIVNNTKSNQEQEDKIKALSKKYEDIMRIVYKNYVDSVDIEKITEEGFKAMLKSLDNQSVYLDREFYKSNKETHTGKQIGLGTTVIKFKDTVLIHYSIFNSPSFKVGIKPGDRLFKIDTNYTKFLSEYEISNLLNGEENSEVKLGVFRKKYNKQANKINATALNDSIFYISHGFEYLEFKVKRQTFAQSSVNSSYQKDNYAYIKLGRFTNVSDRDFIDSLKRFDRKQMKYLIIDLRGNGGGYLDQVVNICGLFLDSGQYVLKSKSTNPNYNVTKSIKKRGEYFGLPLKILVDKESASGSEILAGVVQDYDLGEVYGERTFGKGTVQNTWEFKDGTGFKLTVAEYLTPLERPINKNPKNNTTQLDNSLKLNISDSNFDELQKTINEFGLGKIPIYKSSKGNMLIGGGGIYPNFVMRPDTLSILTQAFTSKRILFEYIHNLITYNLENIDKFKKIEDFESNFKVTDQMLSDFKTLSYTYNTWNQNMFENDKEIIKTLIKSRLAEVLFGQTNYYRIYNNYDRVYQGAINK